MRPTKTHQSLYCPHEDCLQHWLSKMCPVKILITLRECAGCSESSPGANIQTYRRRAQMFKRTFAGRKCPNVRSPGANVQTYVRRAQMFKRTFAGRKYPNVRSPGSNIQTYVRRAQMFKRTFTDVLAHAIISTKL